MAPGPKNRKADEHRGWNAIPDCIAANDCLADTALRGVAAAHTDLSRRTICRGLVERELISCPPDENGEWQHRAQQPK